MAKTQKLPKLSADVLLEDATLIDELKAKFSLNSTKEALHMLCNHYRGEETEATTENETLDCDFLITEATALFCGKNGEKQKKTTYEKCRVCLKCKKAQEKQRQREQYREAGILFRQDSAARSEWLFFKRCGAGKQDFINPYDPLTKWNVALKFLDEKDAEIKELKKPQESQLTEISTLKENVATLETDNTHLSAELQKVNQDSLIQQLKWTMNELTQANQIIDELKRQLGEQATVNS